MKKILALVIAVIMLVAMAPIALAADATVNVSVSIDGKLVLAAQPVSTSDLTVQGALKAAHKAYYSGGESGYEAGVDKTYSMFLISKFWGVATTPYVIVNNAPLGSDPTNPALVDTAPVKNGDNIIVTFTSDPMTPAQPIALTASVSGGSVTVTATAWNLDMTTFTYKTTPLASAKVVDPTTGTALGTTDAKGAINIAPPASGIVAIDGLAAINVSGSTPAAPSGVSAAKTNTAATKTDAATSKSTTAAAPAAVAPSDSAASGNITVSVSVDGKLLVAAQPVTTTDMTVQGALIAAHKAFYSGGESGYKAGTDKTYNMFLISQFWGVKSTPYVILNGAPLGSDMTTSPSADTATIKAGDNIIVSVSSDMTKTATAISLTNKVNGDSATITALSWKLDFTTFTYKSTPFSGAAVIDPVTGESLGVTDSSGSITVPVPASGIVAIDGYAAINVTHDSAISAPSAASSFGGGFGGGTTTFGGGTTGFGGGGFGGTTSFGGSTASKTPGSPIIPYFIIAMLILIPFIIGCIINIMRMTYMGRQDKILRNNAHLFKK